MKNSITTKAITLGSIAITLSMIGQPQPANADPIEQYQDNTLLGYSAYRVDRSWDGIGPESGLLTRSRIVTKYIHASPDFILEGQPYTRTPSYYPAGYDSPNRYGVPGDVSVRIFARTGGVAVSVDPFRTVRQNDMIEIRRAQRQWLRDNGYTDRARIVRRHYLSRNDVYYSVNDRKNKAIPTPRATIEIHPGLKDRRKNDRPLEALILTNEAGLIVLGNVNQQTAEGRAAKLINGTISVTIKTASATGGGISIPR